MSETNNKIIVISGFSACVDCDTEFFNGYEWKRISEYKDGDKVLQYNKNGTANLVHPSFYIKEPCSNMWHFKTKQGLNQCLTDEHEVYYVTSKNNLYHKPFKEVREQNECSINGFSGRFITSFKYGGSGIDLTDNEIKLMCAVISDSSFKGSTNKCFFNLKKERKKESLRNLLKEMDYEWKEKEYKSMEGYTTFILNAPRKEKEFLSYWYNCNQHQLKIICDNILQWDGHIRVKKYLESRTYYTTIKENADFIQFAFSSCGMRASISISDRRGRIKHDKKSNKEYVTKSIDYTICVSNSNLLSLNRKTVDKKIKIQKYNTLDGYKYCFTVDSGILVLRRNNSIFITGNCGKDSIVKHISDNYLYKMITSTTSRPMRENESECNPYRFVTREKIEQMIANDEFIECRKYNTLVNNIPDIWYYGVHKDDVDLENNNYIVVLDFLGFMDFKEQFGDNVVSFFIDVNEPERKKRAVQSRKDFNLTEWYRRYNDDLAQFPIDKIEKNVDYIIKNYNFKTCINEITNKIFFTTT